MNEEMHSASTSEAEQFWEKHYREHERVWSGKPNSVLVDVAGSLPPGTALDLGCAEGSDAIWLAGLGWRVLAVDVSATALNRASAHAASIGVAARIEFQQHDLTRTFPSGAFDLVSAQYFHSPVEYPRHLVLRKAASAIVPGGLLLIVDHASVAPWSWNQDQNRRFPTPEETLDELDLDSGQWDTVRLEAPQRTAIGPNEQRATVTDNIIAVRRRMQ